MVTKNQILNFLNDNKSYLFSDFNLIKIGIFGSFAKGMQNENSDLDLIVEFKPGTQNLYENKLQMKRFFEENLNIRVDICREKYLKNIFKNKILNDATYI